MSYDLEKEKREAIEAGNRALCSLKSARNNLESAKSWGIWDIIGGGFVSSMIKRSKMERAKQDMEHAKYDLKTFSKELNDVNLAYNLNMETDDFLSFADWFFDGFFVDWMVQERIHKATNQVNNAIRHVESILRQLENY